MTRHSTTMSDLGLQSYCSIENFLKSSGPVLDVRSPNEFNQGHLPGAINLPLFTDEERAQVGKTYKRDGRNKAIFLGLKFTKPKVKQLRIFLKELQSSSLTSTEDIEENNLLKLYCWRGGMRSGCLSWLANVSNISTLVLTGGYKTYRKWVLAQFCKNWPLKLIGGRTGTGKTELLQSLKKHQVSIIDLEGLANHRGSSFGGLGLPEQPTSEQYENLIAEQLDHHKKFLPKAIWIEAESAHLGRCRIPNDLYKQMKQAPVLEISRSKEERINNLVDVYSVHNKESLELATTRISRRLGPQRTKEAIQAIENSEWGKACDAMLDYYDRCYEHELAKSPQRKTIDISGLSSDLAAAKLITSGLIQ